MVIIMGIILVKNYAPMPFDKSEILRYAQAKGKSPELDLIIDECIGEVSDKLVYKVCYGEFDISVDKPNIDFGFMNVTSYDLSKNLKDCKKAVVFGATVGIELDRLIMRYGRISPVKALIFQAIGAERIEALSDAFNNEIKEKYVTVPRFSAGYGDFSVYKQTDIFNTLDCGRKIGLTLNDSMMMSPTKSVTAIIGIKGERDNL